MPPLSMIAFADSILIAYIGGVATVVSAIVAGMFSLINRRLERFARRNYAGMGVIEEKIDGIRNGTMPEIKAAIAQLLKEKALHDLDQTVLNYGRRAGDRGDTIINPRTPGKVIEVDP